MAFFIKLVYNNTCNICRKEGEKGMKRLAIVCSLVLGIVLGLAAPAAAQEPVVHVVQPGENLFRIGLRYGLTVNALAAANGITNPHHVFVGQRLVIPGSAGSATAASAPAAGGTYTVQRGDTLYRIALRHGVSTQTLAQANSIINPSHIYAGQVLRIPGGGGAQSAAPQAPAPAPATATGQGRWIDIDLSTQRLTAYENSTAVRSTSVSTGLPRTPTPTGEYRIYVKYRADDMAGPGYYLADVPYVMYFYRGYGLHGTYWHANFGQPMSHGCVNLPTSEAQWLYNWASVGTPVRIHY
jgi:lipoprotein-anchoring transpeptidase ErfK/SrfK